MDEKKDIADIDPQDEEITAGSDQADAETTSEAEATEEPTDDETSAGNDEHEGEPVAEDDEEGGAQDFSEEELEEKQPEPDADVLDQIVLAESAEADMAPDEETPDTEAVPVAEAQDEEIEAVEEPIQDQALADEQEPPTQEAQPISAAAAPASTGRGCSIWTTLLATVLGGFLGVVLTLTLLVIMNGTLRLNESAQIRTLEGQLNRSLATAEAGQEGLAGDVTDLDDRLEIVATSESETAATLIVIGTDVESLTDDLAALQTETEDLDKRLVIIDERVVAIASAAEDFDAFLEGLRTLLSEIETGTPEATITAEVEGTPGRSPTAEPGATARQPTRTPRPTATPLIPAASTPTPAR